jgi:hypothetical protein
MAIFLSRCMMAMMRISLEALTAGATTRLPVSHQAREVLRAMERGWKWR